MVNYQLGKIYKIVDLNTDECYIGSTCEPTLTRRLAKHVGNYSSYLNGTSKYMTSFEIIKNGDYDIILLEKYPCTSKDELHAREGYYQEIMDCVNKQKSGKFKQLGKGEYDKQHGKEYRELNQEKIKLAKEKQYQDNKQKLLKEQSTYYLENKENIRHKQNQYRELNKDKLNEQFECECGGKYTSCHKATHMKTKKHINFCQA